MWVSRKSKGWQEGGGMGEKLTWEAGGMGGEGEAETEKEKWEEGTCGSHYSVGQDTDVFHFAFCQGEVELHGCGIDWDL